MEIEERIEMIYEFIKRFWREHKFSPSMREIVEGLRLGSTDTVIRDLRALREQGRIDFQDKQARTIVVMDMEIVFLDEVDEFLGRLDDKGVLDELAGLNEDDGYMEGEVVDGLLGNKWMR